MLKEDATELAPIGADRTPALPIVVVDDQPEVVQGIRFILRSHGLTNIIGCSDSRDVEGILEKERVSLILLDLMMPHVTGEELLEKVVQFHPEVPAIIITGMNELDVAVQCMRDGAFDYMVKPVEENRLVSGVRRALEHRETRLEYESFRQRVLSGELDHPEAFSNIITENAQMRALFQYIETIARTTKPVLITGETGVGKELVAKAVHELSGLTGEFVAVNTPGLDDTTFADTLFGHAKGAFTGADTVRQGLIERAAGGTLFLDEIGDLENASQVKLLRLLQEREYYPLGGDFPKRSSARIVVATNRDLDDLGARGAFRQDLYYRLKTHHVCVPPLRERMDDLPVLVNHFLEAAADELGKKKPTPPNALYTLLSTYTFPGNVRELQSMVFEAVSQHQSRMLSTEVFKRQIGGDPGLTVAPALDLAEGASAFALFDKLPTLSEAPRLLLIEAMRRAEGNQSVAAQLLGITQSGINKALKRAGL